MEWTIPCKKAASLMVAREDRPLVLRERLGLRWHLVMCKACLRFDAQVLTMRQALGAWRHYQESDSGSGTPTESAGLNDRP